MPLLSHDRLHEVHDAAILAMLDRTALLAGISARVRGSLPHAPTPAEQVLLDLSHLNEAGAMRDGSVPLLVWLQNAAKLAALRDEAQVFEAAHTEAKGAITAQAMAAATPAAAAATAAPRVAAEGPARVVVSFAPADTSYAQALFVHLKPLERAGRLVVWSRDRVTAGAILADEVRAALAGAHVVAALVSADYLAADAIEQDVRTAVRQHKPVVPILVRPVLLQGTPFDGMAMLPRGGRALSGHPSRDDAYVAIVQAIDAAADAARRHAGRDGPSR